MINLFRGEYAFLSNFFNSDILMADGITYGNAEAAFQAQKTLDINKRKDISRMTPNKAKAVGRSLALRPGWDDMKDNVMYCVCKRKFTQNNELRHLLMATGDELLVEGNTWHDIYWGVCNGVGQNKLGKTLMKIRSELWG